MRCLQQKYIDLIRHASSKWGNWDPPIPVEVGAYDGVEYETGEPRVEGNVYTPEFQAELNKLNKLSLRMDDHLPVERSDEDEVVFRSKGVKRLDVNLGPGVGVAGLATASIKGQWQFERGKRDALLIMHRPRIRHMPSDGVLEKLCKVPMLKDKWLVTNVYVCPAYSMYLSDKSGEKVSLVLSTQVPIPAVPGISAGGEGGVGWWSDSQSDLLHKACHKNGEYCYTPLYTMKRRIGWTDKALEKLERVFRQGPTEVNEEDMWEDALPPWDALDSDGEEDKLEMPTSPA